MSNETKGGILVVTDYDQPGNHIPKIAEAIRHMQPGTINHVQVAHDVWCDLLAGKGPCNCDPDVQLLGEEQ